MFCLEELMHEEVRFESLFVVWKVFYLENSLSGKRFISKAFYL